MKAKQELRKEILQRRDALTLEERREKSHQIAEKVISQKEFIEADKVLLFASYKSEVNTSEIFGVAKRLSKDIYYPKVVGKEMEFFKVESEDDLLEGYRGIREPQMSLERQFRPSSTDKICVIMPGAVFDEAGNRIGYGGGYYDKFFHQLEEEFQWEEACSEECVYKLAVAFECQIVEAGQILCDKHDIKPDCVMTEDSMIEVTQLESRE